ncbi:hypothetical protein BZM27_27575 [Paraburkholderia steynii]|uniref:Uncharacterized protein n=1 Tax=Paraburkholderia steynii TaxID=1245441 RepID=A0A4R0XGF8_9BURK|nr:hypothetical protein BZM27_27575 [Paraburkholderia steynii]
MSADALFLPWGPYLDPGQVRMLRAEVVEMIESLAALEGWPQAYRDEVLARAVRGPLSDLLPNHHHFTERTIKAQCTAAAAELRDSRTWHGEGFEKRLTDKVMTPRNARQYRNRRQA